MRFTNDWWLTPARAAIYLPSRTAVIADLHLGYAEARRRTGEAVPGQSTASALSPLEAVLRRHEIRDVVIAGDLIERGRGDELLSEVLQWFAAQRVALRALVPGNHDRGLARADASLPVTEEGVSLGDWQIVHGHQELPVGRIVRGHVHPCLRLRGGASMPCYLARPDQLILPAFSTEAAGANVLRAAHWQEHLCYAVAGEQIVAMGRVGNLKKRRRPH